MQHFNKSIKYLQGMKEVDESGEFKYLIEKKVNSFLNMIVFVFYPYLFVHVFQGFLFIIIYIWWGSCTMTF